VTDARGKTTIFEFDLAGRLIKETDALGKFKSYNYYIDPSQNRITRTDEDSVTIQYFYDDLYRLTQISYPNSTTATFSYDARSNLTSAANPNIGYTFTYDLNNRLMSALDSNNKTITYQYDSLSQRTRVVADGRTIDYTYDSGNRLYQVLSPDPVATITYDLAGRRQTLSYPNLITTTYTFNRASFLTNLLARYNQQTTINSFAYTPDGMGNRINMTDVAGVHNYTYDNTYQLTQAMHPNMPLEQFNYDQVGNRLSSDGQAPGSGMSTEYVYDFENRLIEVNYTSMLAQYKYDPFGRRIEKNLNGTITRYLYDGPNIVTEYDGSWNVQAQYVSTLDIDDSLTVTQGANTYYYHKDGLGSVVNLTDSSGNAVKSYTYKSFGEIYSQTGSLIQPFAFTGREYDPENGLYFYRARYYDPRAGRFLTKDPIGFAGGDVNLYRYVGNNPVNFRDPSGTAVADVHFFLTLAAALSENRSLKESLEMAWDAALRDWGSQKEYSTDTNIHGMIGIDPATGKPQTPEAAIKAALKIIEKEAACGRHGNAMHTIQDLKFFWHRGQEWKGWFDLSAIAHVFFDFNIPMTELWDAFNASRAYLRSQQGR